MKTKTVVIRCEVPEWVDTDKKQIYVDFFSSERDSDWDAAGELLPRPTDEEIIAWSSKTCDDVEDSRWYEPLSIGAKWLRSRVWGE